MECLFQQLHSPIESEHLLQLSPSTTHTPRELPSLANGA